jgi:phage recombination protein Bet
MSTGAIQKREGGDLLDTLATADMGRQALEVMKRQLCPKGIPDDEFYIFVRKCQQTGLNPLAGEAFCIPRRTKGPDGQHVTVHTFQASAEGMRARAGRFPDFLKVDGAAVYSNDTVADVDTGTGEVKHRFNAAKPRGTIVGAWGRVAKKDGTAVVAWLPAGSRRPDGPVWVSDPGGHLAKCAMVQALRQAYPVTFADTYAEEEMVADNAPTRAQEVLGAIEGTATPAPANLPPPPPPEPTVEFGTWKGRLVSSLAVDEAEAAASYALEQLRANPNAKWVKKLEANLDLVQAHRDALASEIPAAPPGVEDAEYTPVNEPGSGG